MALVESVDGGVGEGQRGVCVRENGKREANGVVSDAGVDVGVGEFEVEEHGVVGVVVVAAMVVGCGGVEGGNVEGLEVAFRVLGAECEPQEEACDARAYEEAHAARAAVLALRPPRHPRWWWTVEERRNKEEKRTIQYFASSFLVSLSLVLECEL